MLEETVTFLRKTLISSSLVTVNGYSAFRHKVGFFKAYGKPPMAFG